MTSHIVRQSYGKSKVRISRILREDTRHQFLELAVSISLEGDFDASYVHADNRLVIPTDTIKNTVYALAQRDEWRSIEPFTLSLARHFLDKYAQVRVVSIETEQKPWRPILVGEEQHASAFVGAGSERWRCSAQAEGNEIQLRSGISGLQLLKTSASAFRDFWTDELTTLTNTDDRILATTVESDWPCREHGSDWTDVRARVRTCLLETFAVHRSASVQHTIYEMAQRVLPACSEIDEISLSCPNQHHLLVDLRPFDMDNENEVFCPTEEPYGLISATIRRDDDTR